MRWTTASAHQPITKPVEYPKYTRNAAGEIVPVETSVKPERPARIVGEDGFTAGLDEGMKDLPEVKENAPEGIDFAAGGGQVGATGEFNDINIQLKKDLDTIDINNIVPTSPVGIPPDAVVVKQTKNGYNQIRFKWSEGSYKYEARWHTRTPGAPKIQGDTWVVLRKISGTPTGKMRIQHIMIGHNKWVTRKIWEEAGKAWRNGVATSEQLSILKSGHWPVKSGGNK